MEQEQFSKNYFWQLHDFISENKGPNCFIEELDEFRKYFTNTSWVQSAKFIRYTSGSVYLGEVNGSNQPHGPGMRVSSNGQIYIGYWKNGEFHGEGFYYIAPMIYWGEWENNLQNGKGHMWSANGTESEGHYQDGVEVSNMYRRTSSKYINHDRPGNPPQITFRNSTRTSNNTSTTTPTPKPSRPFPIKTAIIILVVIVALKFILGFISNTFLSSNTSPSQPKSESIKKENTPNVLTREGLGCIRFGMKYAEIPKSCKGLYTHFTKEAGSGYDGAEMEYYFYNNNEVVMTHTKYDVSDKITYIEVLSPQIKTTNGLRVGMPANELVKRKASLNTNDVIMYIVGDYKIIVSEYSATGKAKIDQNYADGTPYKISEKDFTANSVIKSIICSI